MGKRHLSLSEIGYIESEMAKLGIHAKRQGPMLDFNQDKICEFIVLTNGTMVENPAGDKQATRTNQAMSEPTPIQGKCLGLANSSFLTFFLQSLYHGSVRIQNIFDQHAVVSVPISVLKVSSCVYRKVSHLGRIGFLSSSPGRL